MIYLSIQLSELNVIQCVKQYFNHEDDRFDWDKAHNNKKYQHHNNIYYVAIDSLLMHYEHYSDDFFGLLIDKVFIIARTNIIMSFYGNCHCFNQNIVWFLSISLLNLLVSYFLGVYLLALLSLMVILYIVLLYVKFTKTVCWNSAI